MKDRIWVGRGKGKHEIFRAATNPTQESHGALYNAAIGPFKTLRGAKAMLHYGRYGNPHIQCVADAERIGLQHADELMDLPTVIWLN